MNGGDDGGDGEGVFGEGVRGVDGSDSPVVVVDGFGDAGSDRSVDTRDSRKMLVTERRSHTHTLTHSQSFDREDERENAELTCRDAQIAIVASGYE